MQLILVSRPQFRPKLDCTISVSDTTTRLWVYYSPHQTRTEIFQLGSCGIYPSSSDLRHFVTSLRSEKVREFDGKV
jgi:hypothetical protein